jgi:hypothetical protein
MKEENKKIINEVNANRAKIYYQLNQLEEKTGMSPRALKYRMKEVKEKYAGMSNLLFRTGKSWAIHYTLIKEFLPKYKKKQTNVTNHKWETLITWNMKDDYDVNYHIQLLTEVKEHLPSVNIGYVIETDKRGIYHVHAITDGYKDNIEVAVGNVICKYISKSDYRAQVEIINNHGSVTTYLQKYGGITII